MKLDCWVNDILDVLGDPYEYAATPLLHHALYSLKIALHIIIVSVLPMHTHLFKFRR